MEYRIDCADNGIATVTFTGTVTWQQAMTLGFDMLADVQRSGCDRLLMDLREATFEIPTLDLSHLAGVAAGSAFFRMKRALVAGPSLPDLKFYENASRNLGQNMRVFTDIDEARAWLLEDGPTS